MRRRAGGSTRFPYTTLFRSVEPWDFTDIDRTVSGGVSISGKQWGRPADTVGIAGVVNGIAGVHQAFFNAGGLGILIGDGQLPNPGIEKRSEERRVGKCSR